MKNYLLLGASKDREAEVAGTAAEAAEVPADDVRRCRIVGVWRVAYVEAEYDVRCAAVVAAAVGENIVVAGQQEKVVEPSGAQLVVKGQERRMVASKFVADTEYTVQ
jgi:hypothetical protein